jgi:ammonium transporter Rh
MVGTLFLWIYWPSFVIGGDFADSNQQQYGMVNTILALASSTVCAFFLSSLLDANGRFRPVDVQNATLAGGVAIGCTANLTMSGFGAIMIGCAAGLVSCFGFNYAMPWLENNLGIHDTCGVHNLHGMPSVIGGLASVILAGYKGTDLAHDKAIYTNTLVNDQWWRQWIAIFLCMAFAIVSGLITGLIMKACYPEGSSKPFHDDQYWTVADDYGRSLYSELTNILGDAESEVKDAMSNAMPEFSSHAGRRKVTDKPMIMGALPTAIENSQHGKRGYVPVNTASKSAAKSALDEEESA